MGFWAQLIEIKVAELFGFHRKMAHEKHAKTEMEFFAVQKYRQTL